MRLRKDIERFSAFDSKMIFLIVFAVLLLGQSPAQAQCPTGMTHYWRLNETAQPFADTIGANNATCTTCPTAATGIAAGAQLFGGSAGANRVTVADDDSFDWGPTDNFSVELWMRKEAYSGVAEVALSRIDGTMDWWLGVYTDNKIYFQLKNSALSADLRGTQTLAAGTWYHVAVVRDGSAGTVSLYTNGVLDTTVPANYGTTGFAGTQPLTIGWFNTGSYFYWNGYLDEVALYGRALTLSEIQSHHARGLNGFGYCNSAPVLAAIGSQSVSEAANLSFGVSATDAEASAIILTAENTPANASFTDNGNGTGTFNFNPDYTQSGVHNVLFVASDGSASDSELVAITVTNVDRAPVLAAIGAQGVNEGTNLNFATSATDPDGEIPVLTAENVPTNATYTDNGNGTGTFNFNPDYTQAGVFNVRFIATSGALADTEIVAITVSNTDRAPILAAIGAQSVNEGANLNFATSATDPDGEIPVMTAENLPTNATYTDNGNGSGTFNFNPDYTQAGVFNVRFIATSGALADTEIVAITVSNSDRAPVLAAIGAQSVNEGANLNFATSATDPDGEIPVMTAENLPTNATYTDNGNGTGTFNFNPDYTQAGVFNVRFIATSGALADTEIVAITVSNSDRAPVLAAIGAHSVNEGANLNFATSATDPDGEIPVLTAENVPTNATYTDNGNGTGTFNFNPDYTQAGVFNVRFIATSGALADTEIVAITVNNVDRAPVLAAIGAQSINEGANLNFATSATDPDGETPVLTAENVPTNATFTDNGNGTGTFNFNPDYTQAGVFNVRFIATAGALADSEVVQITVTNTNRVPVLASIGARNVTEGANLSFTTSASDPDGATPTMSAINVPANATYTDNGNGTGAFTFDPSFTQAGVFNVTFIASDGSLADSEVVAITVIEAGNQRPVLAAIGPKSLLEGANLNFGVTATDADATFPTLTALNIPTSASFVDHGDGTATFDFNPNYIQAGAYTVTFIASDGILADSEVVSITVNEAGNQRPVLASIGPRSVTEGTILNFAVAATDPDSTVPTLFASGIPTNATFSDNGDGTGSFSFAPIFTQAGTYNVTFIAFDGSLADSELVTITVTEAGNQAPVLATIGPRSVNENANLNFIVSATDPDGSTPSLSARNVPTNATFADNGNGSGTFNFNPSFTQAGVYNVTFIAFDGGKADTEIVAITVNNVNRLPILAAIGAKSVTEGQNLNFGTSGTDPDGTTPTLSAVNVPTNATFTDNGNGTGNFDFDPGFTQAGVYNVTFIASDGSLADSEVVAITVNEAGNQRPILASIGSRSVAENATLDFSVSTSDPDATIPTLSAVGVPANANFTDNGNGTGTFHFTPSFAQAGVHNITFIASDGSLADSEVVAITVTEAGNQAPVLAAIGPKTVNEAATLNFSTSATDADGTTPVMTALNVPTNAAYTDNGNGTGTFNFSPDYTQAGVFNVTFIASDGVLADSEVVAITVNNINRAPVMAAIGSRSVDEGAILNFGTSATDPDGTYPVLTALDLPANASYIDNSNGTATFAFSPSFSQAGVYNITFIASDGALADSEIVVITVNGVNQAPVLATIGPRSVNEGTNLNFSNSASDPDGATPTLTAVGVPTNATFTDNGNGTGVFNFNPSYVQAGVYNVTFIASDGTLADSEVVAITVNDAGNQSPVLATIGPRSVNEGANLNFSISAADADATIPTLTAIGVPTNATFNDNGNGTGTFDFNPDYAQSGIYNVIFIASDGVLADSETVVITVNDAGNQRPVLATIGPRSVTEGANLNFGISATDADATTPALTAVGVPPNATFTDNGNGTGTFNFNPNYVQSGVYSVTFIASDGALADSEVVAITVNNAGNQRPVLAAIGPRSVNEGASLNFSISASDPDATTPNLTAVGVPMNATFADNGNGTATFNFNPDYTQSGIYNVTFVASDGALADSEVVAITVNDAGNQRPVLAAIGPRSVAEGANLNFGISATDADATFPTLSAANMPANATLVDNGNGTATFDFSPDYTQSGVYNVTFIASDGTLADSEVVAITVTNVNLAPTLAAIGPRNVDEGANLNFSISASDPDATTPVLTAISVPTNATFTDNGNGTGTFNFDPDYTQAGVYNVIFIASDGALADSETVAITVSNVNLPPSLAAIGPRNVNEGGHLNFNVSATDPDLTTPSLTALNVPANATFTDNGNGTGVFDFSPDFTQSGSYNVTFIASDGLLADSEIVVITVGNFNRSPVLASIGARVVSEGSILSFGTSATDPDGQIPTLTALDVPSNATYVDNGNGTATFAFTPDYTQSGVYNVTFIASDGSLADSEVVAITVVEEGTGAPPVAVSNLNAQISGDAVRLVWSPVTVDTNGVLTTIDHYTVYRQTTAFFSPTSTDSIGVAPGTASEFFDNNLSGADVVGDTAVNYFYVVRAVDAFGGASTISNRVGEYDYPIVVTATTDFNLAALPFAGTGIIDAAGLITSLGGSTNVNTVNNFVPSSQSYQARFAAGFGVNFAVQPGSVFQVNAKQNFTWSIAGQVPDSGSLSYNVVTTATTNYSLIMVPLEYANVFTVAQDVINNIPGLLNTLNEFLPNSQSYRSRFAAGFGTNFAVKAGRVYQANGKAAGVFPHP